MLQFSARRGKAQFMKPFTHLGAVLFAVVACAHLLRLVFGWPMIIGTWSVPMWVSWLGLIVPGILAVMLWKEA